MARVLIIDDEPDVLAILSDIFNSAGHEVRELANAADVVRTAQQFQPDLVALDILMPGVTGGAVYRELRRAFGPGLPVIVISGLKTRFRAERDPLLRYCPKPINHEFLLKEAQALLAAAHAGAKQE